MSTDIRGGGTDVPGLWHHPEVNRDASMSHGDSAASGTGYGTQNVYSEPAPRSGGVAPRASEEVERRHNDLVADAVQLYLSNPEGPSIQELAAELASERGVALGAQEVASAYGRLQARARELTSTSPGGGSPTGTWAAFIRHLRSSPPLDVAGGTTENEATQGKRVRRTPPELAEIGTGALRALAGARILDLPDYPAFAPGGSTGKLSVAQVRGAVAWTRNTVTDTRAELREEMGSEPTASQIADTIFKRTGARIPTDTIPLCESGVARRFRNAALINHRILGVVHQAVGSVAIHQEQSLDRIQASLEKEIWESKREGKSVGIIAQETGLHRDAVVHLLQSPGNITEIPADRVARLQALEAEELGRIAEAVQAEQQGDLPAFFTAHPTVGPAYFDFCALVQAHWNGDAKDLYRLRQAVENQVPMATAVSDETLWGIIKDVRLLASTREFRTEGGARRSPLEMEEAVQDALRQMVPAGESSFRRHLAEAQPELTPEAQVAAAKQLAESLQAVRRRIRSAEQRLAETYGGSEAPFPSPQEVATSANLRLGTVQLVRDFEDEAKRDAALVRRILELEDRLTIAQATEQLHLRIQRYYDLKKQAGTQVKALFETYRTIEGVLAHSQDYNREEVEKLLRFGRRDAAAPDEHDLARLRTLSAEQTEALIDWVDAHQLGGDPEFQSELRIPLYDLSRQVQHSWNNGTKDLDRVAAETSRLLRLPTSLPGEFIWNVLNLNLAQLDPEKGNRVPLMDRLAEAFDPESPGEIPQGIVDYGRRLAGEDPTALVRIRATSAAEVAAAFTRLREVEAVSEETGYKALTVRYLLRVKNNQPIHSLALERGRQALRNCSAEEIQAIAVDSTSSDARTTLRWVARDLWNNSNRDLARIAQRVSDELQLREPLSEEQLLKLLFPPKGPPAPY